VNEHVFSREFLQIPVAIETLSQIISGDMHHAKTKKLGAVKHQRELEIVDLRSDCGRAGRLAALGFLPGQRVRISRIAPLGDPISIEMSGQEISLRRAEADLIEVKETL
jgi:ferrous iron transport protein A